MTDSIKQAIEKFRKLGSTFRTRAALQEGVHPRTLYAMRDSGVLEILSRGVYRLTEKGPMSNPDLVTVASRVPQGVICLISALSFHNLTTQVPHSISIALCRTMRNPSLKYPPLTVYRYDENCYQAGIEEHLIDGVIVKVYCPEKTLADCFKFRNKIGMDIVLEALKRYREHQSFKTKELMKYAAVCRVERVMKPYLEALL
jgi:predicted transcriptional regulator of viral defense system